MCDEEAIKEALAEVEKHGTIPWEQIKSALKLPGAKKMSDPIIGGHPTPPWALRPLPAPKDGSEAAMLLALHPGLAAKYAGQDVTLGQLKADLDIRPILRRDLPYVGE